MANMHGGERLSEGERARAKLNKRETKRAGDFPLLVEWNRFVGIQSTIRDFILHGTVICPV